MSDCTIIKRLKRNDEKGIEMLIDKYSRYVAAVIWALSKDTLKPEDVEELISDVFYALWKRRKELLETESLKPYLAQTTRNMTKNKFKSLKEESSINEEELFFENHDTENLMIQREEIDVIKEFLNRMRSPDGDILKSYYFLNVKLEDISLRFKLPLSTVKSKIYRGRKSIAAYFKERGFK